MQLELFESKFYRCQNCGMDVDHVKKVNRFNLCNACYGKIFPAEGDCVQIGEFWRWRERMDKKFPLNRCRSRINLERDYSLLDFAICCPVCGRERKEIASTVKSLWGGPRECRYCLNIGLIKSAFRLQKFTHQEWDDEDWLDWMYHNFHDAFGIGILPDLWFELKHST